MPELINNNYLIITRISDESLLVNAGNVGINNFSLVKAIILKVDVKWYDITLSITSLLLLHLKHQSVYFVLILYLAKAEYKKRQFIIIKIMKTGLKYAGQMSFFLT